ncbi:MAG: FHA domain-containing protein [Planctomycetes bacterium]|nr:FHA domain-containing protein [Planctomycetota bacterium]
MSGFLELADGRQVPVRDGLTIGRVAGCDVVIDDTKASRKHARIVVEGSIAEVLDLDSSNGTLLNGKPVQKRVLRPGDEIRIGTTVIIYRESAMAAPAASPPAPAPRPAPSAPPPVPVRPPLPPPPAPAATDDVDLFGSDEPPPAPPPAPVAPPVASRPVAPPPPAPPPPPARNVVEFADEVVEVRKPVRPEPVIGAAPAPAPASAGIQQKQRVLQFSQNVDTGNPLRDDLGQMAGPMKAVIVLSVLAAGVAIVWLIMRAMA